MNKKNNTGFIIKETEEAEIIPRFLEICADFRKQWEEHLEYWGKDERGMYNDIAEFAHFIVDSYKDGKTEKFPEVFKQIESYLVNGDEKVKEIISIGLLEDIQNIASHEEHGYEVFEKWLGPVSKKYWKEIEALWQGKSSLADVIRAEKRREK